MPFSRFVLVSGAGLAVLAFVICYLLFNVSEAEWKAFEERSSIPMQKKAGSARQERMHTAKALLLSEGFKRKYAELKSETSTLIYSDSKGFIEEMQGVKLLYQEELFPSSQQLLFLKAEKAVYDEREQKLNAEGVDIARYLIPGLMLPKTIAQEPFFKGHSDKIDVSLTNEGPILEAENLKAEFF